jgi:hypothetical protein
MIKIRTKKMRKTMMRLTTMTLIATGREGRPRLQRQPLLLILKRKLLLNKQPLLLLC